MAGPRLDAMTPDLEHHPAILSLRDEGFLSPAIADFVPTLRAMQAPWFDLIGRINRHGQAVMNNLEALCNGRSTHDPISLATRLLMRSLSAFQGAVLLAERGLATDAEALARGVYENAFWLGYLQAEPQAAVAALIADELRSQKSRDRALLKDLDRAQTPRPDLQAMLTARIAKADSELKGAPKKLDIEKLAEKGDVDAVYFAYKMLSSGAAHASLHSLAKHLNVDADGELSGHVTGPDVDVPRAR